MLWVWRHPKPLGVEGRCIGRSEVSVPLRRLKRLAHRIERTARREQLPRVVYTSPSWRCRAVGKLLRRRGWHHVVDPLLHEMDFGAWEGLHWDDIPRDEIEAWTRTFATARPGGGECLLDVLERARQWRAPPGGAVLVGHAGWMLARQWVTEQRAPPDGAGQWPRAPRYGVLWRIPAASRGAASPC